MISGIIQIVLSCVLIVVLAVPLGSYIGKVMEGERVWLWPVVHPVEKVIYRVLKIDSKQDMDGKTYGINVGLFSVIGFLVLGMILAMQQWLPLNPQQIESPSWHLNFNTAASYVTNTNWQSYAGESDLSYFSQMVGLTVQNFASPAVGICVLFVLIRGFIRTKQKGIGNFYVDVTRIVLYLLIPASLIFSLFLVFRGVPQTFGGYEQVQLLEPVQVVMEDGTVQMVDRQVIPLGPVGSQESIKLLGSNGGGFFGANSAHPFENPDAYTNLAGLMAILLIPAALCFAFGRNVKDKRQGRAIFIAMGILLILGLSVVTVSEQNGSGYSAIYTQSGENMEGKETRFGIETSSAWSVFTTASSNGSSNSSISSYTPLSKLVMMLQMQIGEVVFGGVGCGLYGMLIFAIMTVFIAGLMVGRTPEYLGKKIEPYEMKMAVLACLATPVAILTGSGIAAGVSSVVEQMNHNGAYGFTQLLYVFSSAGANNGSSFPGFNTNTPYLNISMGLVMLFARFLPMMAVISIAASLAGKKKTAVSAGTLPTHNGVFIFLLIFVVLLIGALSFFPALALGPVAEWLGMIS